MVERQTVVETCPKQLLLTEVGPQVRNDGDEVKLTTTREEKRKRCGCSSQ